MRKTCAQKVMCYRGLKDGKRLLNRIGESMGKSHGLRALSLGCCGLLFRFRPTAKGGLVFRILPRLATSGQSSGESQLGFGHTHRPLHLVPNNDGTLDTAYCHINDAFSKSRGARSAQARVKMPDRPGWSPSRRPVQECGFQRQPRQIDFEHDRVHEKLWLRRHRCRLGGEFR